MRKEKDVTYREVRPEGRSENPGVHGKERPGYKTLLLSKRMALCGKQEG